uniref:Uncharacterized protein n=1 Tax=Steinernema glaseri TaxID=37863 RepID=A0A1I7YLI7_9BILA
MPLEKKTPVALQRYLSDVKLQLESDVINTVCYQLTFLRSLFDSSHFRPIPFTRYRVSGVVQLIMVSSFNSNQFHS